MTTKNFFNIKILSILFISIIISIIFESILIDKIAVFIFFVSLLLLGVKEKTFLNPYYLFVFTPFSLLIYFNVIDLYMVDLTHKTYLLVLINMMAFIAALTLGPFFKVDKKKGYGEHSKRSLRLITFVLFGLSFIGFLVPFFYSIFWLLSIPAIVFAMKTKEKKMILVVLIYILLIASIKLSKTAVLLYILTFLISLEKFYSFYGKQAIRLKIFTGFGIFFLIFAFSFANKERGDYDADEGLEYFTRQGGEWQYDSAFFLPYMYLATPWTNLQYVTESQDTRTYGLWTLKPLINYFQIDEDFEKEYTLVPYSSFNTFTFVAVGFKDFGYWFSTLASLILGFFVKKVYCRFLVSQSPFDTATYVIFSLATLEMFFSNHFYMVSYPFTMLIVMWISKFCVYKG
jgi:hypothetical protein